HILFELPDDEEGAASSEIAILIRAARRKIRLADRIRMMREDDSQQVLRIFGRTHSGRGRHEAAIVRIAEQELARLDSVDLVRFAHPALGAADDRLRHAVGNAERLWR